MADHLLRGFHRYAVIGLAVVTLISSATAQEVVIACPAGSGDLAALDLRFGADVLTLVDTERTSALPARLNGDPAGIYIINASGLIETMMPPLDALDTCLTDKLATLGFTAANADELAYAANGCRLDLKDVETLQPAQAVIEVTVMDPRSAMVFIARTYTAPSAVTGAPVELAEFPPLNCSLAN